MSSIFELVKQEVDTALALRGDSTPFFDWLDQRLCAGPYLQWLGNKVLDQNPKPYAILGSGKFGWAFSMYNHARLSMPPVLNFPGDLRHQPLVDPLVDPYFQDREFVYVDNSIYKGRTLGQINTYVNDWGGKITRAYILYDGTYPPHDAIPPGIDFHYVYRWHDGKFRVWNENSSNR